MLLAVNYSPQAARVLARDTVGIDLFKCPNDQPELLRLAERHLPCYVHFDGWCGQGAVTQALLSDMQQHLHNGRCRYVNTHLGPPVAEASTPTEAFDQALERVAEEYRCLCDQIGAEKVLLENVPWEARPGFPFPPVAADPRLLTTVLERFGGWLLLDLAHVRIATAELGLDPFAYLERLPTHLLRELHVTGVGRDQSGRVRDSMPMTDVDWQLCAHALDNIAAGAWAEPWVVALEYGGVGQHFAWRSEEQILAEQLPRLEELLCERGLR